MGCCQTKASEGGYRRRAKSSSGLVEDLMPKLSNDARVVVVRLVGLADIPAGNTFGGVSDAFVEFKLSPNDVVAGEQKEISSVKPGSLHPKWEPPERFQFIATQPKDSKLVISVYHYIYGKATESLALADGVLKLKDLTGGAAQEKVVKLSTPQENNPAGEAKIIIQLLAVAEAAAFQEHVVYEFQRWQPSYSSTSWAGEHLLPSDPGMWCSGDGAHFGKNRELVAPDVPTGWEVTSSWHTVTSDGDPEGWQYASDFKSPYWYTSYSSGTYLVRRRSWHREIRKTAVDQRAPSITSNPLAVASAGGTGTAGGGAAGAVAGKPGRRQRLVTGRQSG